MCPSAYPCLYTYLSTSTSVYFSPSPSLYYIYIYILVVHWAARSTCAEITLQVCSGEGPHVHISYLEVTGSPDLYFPSLRATTMCSCGVNHYFDQRCVSSTANRTSMQPCNKQWCSNLHAVIIAHEYLSSSLHILCLWKSLCDIVITCDTVTLVHCLATLWNLVTLWHCGACAWNWWSVPTDYSLTRLALEGFLLQS